MVRSGGVIGEVSVPFELEQAGQAGQSITIYIAAILTQKSSSNVQHKLIIF